MKTIKDHLGHIILAIAAVALIIGIVLSSTAPMGHFFGGVFDKLDEVGNGKIWEFGNFNIDGSGNGGEQGGSDGSGGTPIVDPALNHSEIIPAGGTYYVGVTSIKTGDYSGATTTYTAGDSFPDTVKTGDVYVYEDYEYRFNYEFYNDSYDRELEWHSYNEFDGWGVRVIDNTKTSYSAILESINGKNITSLMTTFDGCVNLVVAPVIPSNVTTLYDTFAICESLEVAPAIPDKVTDMTRTFCDCDSLTTAPVIPSNVSELSQTFEGCTSLTGEIEINSSSIGYCWACFLGVDFEEQNITLTGTSPYLTELANTQFDYGE